MLINVRIDEHRLQSRYVKAFSPGGDIMVSVDKMVMRDIKPYVPYDTGDLSRSAKRNSEVGTGVIMWSSPYAKNIWHGKTNSGSDMKFDKTRSPLAGPRWTERYKADHLDNIKRMVIEKVREL